MRAVEIVPCQAGDKMKGNERVQQGKLANSLRAGESDAASSPRRRVRIPLLIAAVAVAVSFPAYKHLRRQALSQGFVLEELEPLMNLLIGWGRSLYWFGGRPLAAPAVLLAASAILVVCYYIFHKKRPVLSAAALLMIVALSFSLMYVIGGTRSFPLYIAGIAAIPVLGWFSQWGRRQNIHLPVAAPAASKESLLLTGILLIGLLLRLYQVDVFPRMYSIDEQLLAQVSLELAERPLQFFSEPHIMKPHLLRIGSIWVTFSTLGVGLFQHRTLSVLEGTFTILLVYLLCRRLWGARAGLFAALLLAVDPWHIGHSRFGVHNIEGPLFAALLLVLILRAVRRGGKSSFASLGAAAGATFYLYLSCLIMTPFAWAASLLGRRFVARADWKTLAKEAAAMAVTFILVALPYFTVGRRNIGELEKFYSTEAHFLAASEDYGWNPAFTVFVNAWNGIEFLVNWSARTLHPWKTFYPNPIAVGLFLLGLGILARGWRKFENLLVLAWIPVAWIPMSLSYGFAERRLFATLVLILPMLGGLVLAKLWEKTSDDSDAVILRLRRAVVAALLVPLILVSLFIVYEDADPVSGGRVHPRKVAEYIGSLPPEYNVLISNRVKEIPFLVYLQNHERLQKMENKQALSFLPIETLEPMAQQIASSSRLAVVTDAGLRERRLLKRIIALNPEARVYEGAEFLSIVVDGGLPQ